MAHTPKKILVPVDFSQGSKLAAVQAGSLAKGLGATLDLLNVWEVPSHLPADALIGPGPDSVGVLAAKVARHEMDTFSAQLRAEGVVLGETTCRHGGIAETIVETAKTGSYDLIAMGTHGRTGLPHLLIGSIAEKVVRLAPCPVLTVPLPK